MFLNLVKQLIRYNDHLPRHMRTGIIWFRAEIKNSISWRYIDKDKIKRINEFCDSRRWVFLLGCNNSGTSLVRYLLARHPHIASFPIEGHFLTTVFPVPMTLNVGRRWTEKIEYFRLTEKDSQPDRTKLRHDWFNQIKNKMRPIVIEKSPPDTVRSRWLQEIFGSTYFIGMVRNGYAVAEGVARRKKVDIFEGARHWINANSIMIQDAKYLKNFKLIKYEDFVRNPEQVIKDLLDFIGADSNLFHFDVKERLHIHNINGQRSEIYDFNQKSIARIPPNVLKELSTEIEPMMEKLGY